MVYLNPISDLVLYLPIWLDGLKYIAVKPDGSLCGYIYCGLENIQRHYRSEHSWENTRKRGRAPKGRQPEVNKLWVEGMHYQQFFKTGGFQRLFKVEAAWLRQDQEEEGGICLTERWLEATF